VFTGPVQDLIEELSKLPGIGPKTAQRLAFHILKTEDVDAKRLAEAILEVKDKMRFCDKCFNVSTTELCEFCSDPRRDQTIVCVVEEPRDIWAIEKTAEFRGRYHVLGGAISPIDGIGPDQLHISELIERLEPDGIKEIIVATNPNVEGDATAIYIARLIGPLGVEVSRISSGLPVGGDLEYADEVTLGRALEGRRRM